MNRRNRVKFAATAFAGAFALLQSADLRAQDASSAGLPTAPRSRDQRIVTETPVPPTANSDALKAAEGRLKTAPGQVAPGVGAGSIDPAARGVLPPGTSRSNQGDPATRLQPAVVAPAGPGSIATAAPVGMDVAMLTEHAVGMAIEATALQAIAEQAKPGATPADPARMLLDHSRMMMQESKALLTQAATEGRNVPAGSPSRRFYSAANNYVATLGALSGPNAPSAPIDRAQVAMINHSVKSALDADHILHMGGASGGSVALEQLLNHARGMKTGGTQTISRLAGDAAIDPNGVPSATLLAQRGRELLDAANQLSTSMQGSGAMVRPARDQIVAPGVVPAAGDNVGRLRDTRPEIIGGTFGTGSPTAGTATGPEAAANVKVPGSLTNGETSVSPSPGNPGTGTNTPKSNSNAGSRPR